MKADRVPSPDSLEEWIAVQPYPKRHQLVVMQRQVVFEVWRSLYDKEETDD